MNSTSAADRGGSVAWVDGGSVLVGAPGAPGCTTTGFAGSACCAHIAEINTHAHASTSAPRREPPCRREPGWRRWQGTRLQVLEELEGPIWTRNRIFSRNADFFKVSFRNAALLFASFVAVSSERSRFSALSLSKGKDLPLTGLAREPKPHRNPTEVANCRPNKTIG